MCFVRFFPIPEPLLSILRPLARKQNDRDYFRVRFGESFVELDLTMSEFLQWMKNFLLSTVRENFKMLTLSLTASADIFFFDRHPCSKQLYNYLPIYDLYLSPIRHSVKRVLEIGVEAGDSLKMWEDYFPNAEIHGFDINPNCKQFEGGRRRIHIGDQEKISDYDSLPDDFDVVIDDGSHQTKHQIISFKHVFLNRMRQRGVYFVEDITNRPKTVDFFIQFAHSVNYYRLNLTMVTGQRSTTYHTGVRPVSFKYRWSDFYRFLT